MRGSLDRTQVKDRFQLTLRHSGFGVGGFYSYCHAGGCAVVMRVVLVVRTVNLDRSYQARLETVNFEPISLE